MTPADRCILRVGLTGSIGAGKSTVGAMLGRAGCLVIDADRIARGLLESDPEVAGEIVAAFGPAVRSAGGGIDREALAQIVFADPAARRRLESITHPRIRDAEQRCVDLWEVERGIAVTEAALLVETGGFRRYHRLVVVVAPEQVRRARLLARGMTPGDIQRRTAAQMSQQEKARAADHVIDNGGDLRATREQVPRLLEDLGEALRRMAEG